MVRFNHYIPRLPCLLDPVPRRLFASADCGTGDLDAPLFAMNLYSFLWIRLSARFSFKRFPDPLQVIGLHIPWSSQVHHFLSGAGKVHLKASQDFRCKAPLHAQQSQQEMFGADSRLFNPSASSAQ